MLCPGAPGSCIQQGMFWNWGVSIPLGLSDEAPPPGALHPPPETSSELPVVPALSTPSSCHPLQSFLFAACPDIKPTSISDGSSSLLLTIPASCARILTGTLHADLPCICFPEQLSHTDTCAAGARDLTRGGSCPSARLKRPGSPCPDLTMDPSLHAFLLGSRGSDN